MKKTSVEFKGTKEGVTIYCLEGLPFADILAELAERLRKRAAFFAEAEVRVDVGSRQLSSEEKEKLLHTISQNSHMKLVGVLTADERVRPVVNNRRHDREERKAEGFRESRSLVIKRTLRSGQSIHFPGTVVILGDVNPGAEIVAEGDIIVFGTVRGIAHAGAGGDRSASVVALRLAPTQLRIADKISRAPDEVPLLPDQPEYAFINEDRIMIASINTRMNSQ